MYFQQDGASAHYSLVVRSWLDEKFPNRWIGRRGPIEWPARSPDLTPPDLFLWGYLKDQVYVHRPSTITQLKEQIERACAMIPVEMCTKVCQKVPHRLKQCYSGDFNTKFGRIRPNSGKVVRIRIFGRTKSAEFV